MKLKKKNILSLFMKALAETGVDVENLTSKEIRPYDRLAFKLSCEQDMELRKQQVQEEINKIKSK